MFRCKKMFKYIYLHVFYIGFHNTHTVILYSCYTFIIIFSDITLKPLITMTDERSSQPMVMDKVFNHFKLSKIISYQSGGSGSDRICTAMTFQVQIFKNHRSGQSSALIFRIQINNSDPDSNSTLSFLQNFFIRKALINKGFCVF